MINTDLSELKLEDLGLFITVVESASLTLAAEQLNTSTSTLSRRLQKLEQCLGSRLFNRTTRRIQITESGDLFYQHCQQVLSQFEQLKQEVNDEQEKISGRLSVYAPAELFRYFIKELVVEFSRQYPNLNIEFVSGGAKPQLLKGNLDILIHIDEPEDSSFIARKINDVNCSFYASPDYIAQRGQPKTPEEMIFHDCIVENDQDRNARPWKISDAQSTKIIKVPERYSSDSAELCRALAEQSQGISMLPDFIAQESVLNGQLVKLFRGASHKTYAMYASRQYIPRKIKAFVDFLSIHIPEQV